jgi:hypothetical protein
VLKNIFLLDFMLFSTSFTLSTHPNRLICHSRGFQANRLRDIPIFAKSHLPCSVLMRRTASVTFRFKCRSLVLSTARIVEALGAGDGELNWSGMAYEAVAKAHMTD